MAVADQLGDFSPFLNLHGSFAKAIEEIVRPVMAPSVKEGAQLRTDVEQAFSQVATDIKAGERNCLDMICDTVEAMEQRADKDERRLRALERALRTGGMSSTASLTPAVTPFDPNTTVTMIDIGGNPVSISFNHLFQKTQELESKVEVLLE